MKADIRYEYASTTSAGRGYVAIAKKTMATASGTLYDRRASRSIVLKLRNRMVLTISSAGTSISASAGSALM